LHCDKNVNNLHYGVRRGDRVDLRRTPASPEGDNVFQVFEFLLPAA
jgi:hypothetical protein